jgi:hypothetical protein
MNAESRKECSVCCASCRHYEPKELMRYEKVALMRKARITDTADLTIGEKVVTVYGNLSPEDDRKVTITGVSRFTTQRGFCWAIKTKEYYYMIPLADMGIVPYITGISRPDQIWNENNFTVHIKDYIE